MPPRKRIVVAGAAVALVGLVVLFPARVAYHWFTPPGVALSGIEGSVWRGRALHASMAGLYAGNLRWRIAPLSLLSGKLAYRIEAAPAGGFIDGSVGVGFGGDLHVSGLSASLPLAAVESFAGIRGIRGMANSRIERLRIADGTPVAADGSVEVADLAVPMIAPFSIGGYRAEFFTEEDGIVASVEDTDGIVDLAGRLLLSPDRSYQFLGQLAPKPDTPERIREQMKFLGTANARGQYELRLEGSL
ncbi:MAG: type II secretion system protein N [Woeseiaceae bacterium]|nr:type II secretion system protein N [Woeseiaceae bacterium]